MALVDEINNTIKSEQYPDWKPVIFQTDGLPRSKLVAHYLAMDVGVVTPSKVGFIRTSSHLLAYL